MTSYELATILLDLLHRTPDADRQRVLTEVLHRTVGRLDDVPDDVTEVRRIVDAAAEEMRRVVS
jgi:hypothetical protein